ncbi:unnamed protein product [Nippostrongylus brasiliensis]|uniref:BPTI/Kunitz inhibitor domain-containing protein n=1 Tax=Nippostrongylus brasiliensis TaxID=27835 RepID=A0A158QWF3_NIPBR|nr:unnamed protein product [Nippostrongylus brasiliensis]
MLALLVLALVKTSSQQPRVPDNTYQSCLEKLDRGNCSCTSPNTTIRFYFDEVLEDCFTYLYEGCGGGRNTFYEEALCRQTCIPADKYGCAGNKEPTGGCTDTDQTCPAGSTCFSGPFGVGPCCDDANEKEWDEARNPSCKVGELLMRNVFYGITPWLGKSCSHRFCPFGYDCIQGKRFAHCCGPIPNFTEKIYPETEDSSGGTSTYTKNNPPPLMSILSTNNAHGNADDEKNSQTGGSCRK